MVVSNKHARTRVRYLEKSVAMILLFPLCFSPSLEVSLFRRRCEAVEERPCVVGRGETFICR